MPGPTQVADPFECPICKKRFASKANKRLHVIIVHQNSGRFKCGHCDKTFQSQVNLKTHERVHTGEKPFCCKICQKQFTFRSYLNVHHLDYHAEKKFRCQVCDKGFGRDYRLQMHHLDCHAEKKFRCDTCGKSFGRKFRLKSHLQCHSNERFECGQCESSYKHPQHLKKHQALHHSAIQRETSGRRCLARGKDQREPGVKVLQSNRNNGSSSSTYGLRARGKPPSYRDDQNESDECSESRSSGDSENGGQDNDEEPSEPGQARGDGEQQNGRTENDRNVSANVLSDRVQDTSPMIILSSDEESDGERESSTVSSANLKLVYDVEYRAPN